MAFGSSGGRSSTFSYAPSGLLRHAAWAPLGRLGTPRRAAGYWAGNLRYGEVREEERQRGEEVGEWIEHVLSLRLRGDVGGGGPVTRSDVAAHVREPADDGECEESDEVAKGTSTAQWCEVSARRSRAIG